MHVRFAGETDLHRLRPVWFALIEYYQRDILLNQVTSSLGAVRGPDESWADQERACRFLLRRGGWIPYVEFRDKAVGYCSAYVNKQPAVWGSEPLLITVSFAVLPLLARPAAEHLRDGLRLLGRQLGVRRWSATCLAADAMIRGFFEAQGGEVAHVIYYGEDDGVLEESSSLTTD